MSKKLYIYGIILIVVYGFFIINYLWGSFLGGKMGFNFALEQVMESNNLDFNMIALNLIPETDKELFPSYALNEKTGENMQMMVSKGMVFFYETTGKLPLGLSIGQGIFNFIILLFQVFLFFYMPIKSFSIFKAVSKKDFYNQKNIKNLRKISYSILALFICSLITQVIDGLVARFYLDVSGYKIILFEIDYIFLFLGLILLIMSEILLYTTSMKEEHEYTI